jgi:hypothetical protein
MKKKSFTLVELIIGFFFFTIVSCCFFGFLLTHSYLEKKVDMLQQKIERLSQAEFRLKELFNGALFTFSTKQNPQNYFFTEEKKLKKTAPALIFTFDNGVDKVPEFSCDPLGKLFFDEKKKALVFITWPNPAKFPPHDYAEFFRKEVLLEPIENYTIQFCKVLDSADEKCGVQWVEEWNKGEKKLPLLIKIECDTILFGEGSEHLVFCFPVGPTKAFIPRGG